MDQLMELLKTRRTYRRFRQREIPQETVEEILEAAHIHYLLILFSVFVSALHKINRIIL